MFQSCRFLRAEMRVQFLDALGEANWWDRQVARRRPTGSRLRAVR